MHQRNRPHASFVMLIGLVLCLGTLMVAQNSATSSQVAPANAAGQPMTSAQNSPAQTAPANAPAQSSQQEAAPLPQPPNQPGDTVQVPQKGEEPEKQPG